MFNYLVIKLKLLLINYINILRYLIWVWSLTLPMNSKYSVHMIIHQTSITDYNNLRNIFLIHDFSCFNKKYVIRLH